MSLPQGLDLGQALAPFRRSSAGSRKQAGKKPASRTEAGKQERSRNPRKNLAPRSQEVGTGTAACHMGSSTSGPDSDDDFEQPMADKVWARQPAVAATARRPVGSDAVQDFERWLRETSTAGQLVHVHRVPARAATTKMLTNLQFMKNKKLLRTLQERPLYSHQADAIDAVLEGENVCIATGTASGKSRCFLVPCMEVLSAVQDSRCLFIYPMKALAQDQRRATEELAHSVVYKRLRVATYDGDTPAKERPGIRKSGRIVLTNPDMLHIAILPHHAEWSGFLTNLQFVIIDEAHIYKGVFGSHMAHILRRLRRICKHYGSAPQFILSSATIANPRSLCQSLIGLPVRVIDNDGSPSAGRTMVLWNPPLLDGDGDAVRRKSANVEATTIFTELVIRKLKCICFVRARKAAEVVLQQATHRLKGGHAELLSKIQSYRAGYSSDDRREIEKKLFSGELLGVTATNALELGVDVGGLDATVCPGARADASLPLIHHSLARRTSP